MAIPLPPPGLIGSTPSFPSAGPLTFAPGATSMFPAGATSTFGPMLGPLGPSSVGGAGLVGDTAAAGGWLSRLRPVLPFTEGGVGAAGLAKAFGYPIAGNLAGNLTTKLFGGDQAIEKNHLAEGLRGGLKGAGYGAAVGTTILPGLGTGLGAAAGALVGGIADELDLGRLFGGDKNKDVKAYEKALPKWQALLAATTGNDTASANFINQQLEFQAQVIMADDTMSKNDKAKNLAGLISQGQQMLSQYVANPAAFRQQATQAQGTGITGGALSAEDMMALQAVAGKYLNPIADQIEQTGQQYADIYAQGGAVGGAQGQALKQQGQGIALAAKNLANSYRAQSALLPMKYVYDQYGVPQPSMQSSPQGYTQQQSQGGTSAATDALLQQLAAGNANG